MPQLVGMKACNPVFLGKLAELVRRAGGVHRLCAAVLSKDKSGPFRLLSAKLLQQLQGIATQIHHTAMSVFGGVQVNTPLWSITQIPVNENSLVLKVHIFPLDTQRLPPSDAGINQQMDKGPPL